MSFINVCCIHVLTVLCYLLIVVPCGLYPGVLKNFSYFLQFGLIKQMNARAQQYIKCIAKVPGHLERLGGENDLER